MQHDLPLRLTVSRSARVSTLALTLAVSAGVCASPALAIDRNAEGWTILEPSVDTRIIFVSSSEGDDRNTGLTPSRPVKTLARAEELVRDGYPDWVLLKRGDTWTEGFSTWRLSGRSDDERILISAYGDGDERPRVVLSDQSFIVGPQNDEVSHVAIVGIAIEGDRAEDESAIGVRWLSTGENLLIEDCLISGFKDNIVVQAVGGEYRNFELRRSVIVDSWSTGGHSQGIYVSGGNGVLLEENVFDHNGWNEAIAEAEADVFNQNVYLQTSTINVEFIGNITSRAAAAGVQMRSGGHARDNLIYGNSLGLRFGYPSLEFPEQAASGSVVGNVISGAPMVDPSLPGAGIGFWIERADQALIQNNVVTRFGYGNMPIAFSLNGYAGEVEFLGNVAYNDSTTELRGQAIKSPAQVTTRVLFKSNRWYLPETSYMVDIWYPENMQFSGNEISGVSEEDDVFYVDRRKHDYGEWLAFDFVDEDEIDSSLLDFPDPGRDLDAYARSLGYDGAEAFIEAARGMSRANWDARLTGRAAARWIRAGYISEE